MREAARETAERRARVLITAAEAAYVEELAILYESFGFPRMAGRIMGWLLICDPPHQSLEQLGKVLKASKGSISTMTRLLLQFGIARRVSLPGDRRDYIAIPEGWLSSLWAQQTHRSHAVAQIAAKGLQLLQGATGQRRPRLQELHDMYEFLDREMPQLLARWQREKKRT
jgi:DNA-binding transcriptional regulator GbsR (MarR family)